MKNYSLYVKLNLLIAGAIFLCGLLIGGSMLYTLYRTLENSLDHSGREIAASLGAVIGSDILVDDRFAISDRLRRAQEENDQVRYIIAVAPTGEILATTFTDGLPAGLPVHRENSDDTAQTLTFASNEGFIREILYPINEGTMGSLRIGMTEKQMMYLMQVRSGEIAVIILLVCLAAAVVATRYASLFLRPVRNMAQAVRQIRQGNYSVAVPVETDDEVGHLARTFNRMAHHLQVKDEENSHLMKRLFSAREDECRRISRELHDETGQSMASILAYLRILHDQLTTPQQREMLLAVRDLTAQTLAGLRQMAVDLHPPMLDDLGLLVALEKYLETFRQTQPQLTVMFYHEGDFASISHTAALVCYRTVQEALTNVVRHAQASHVSIHIEAGSRSIAMSVTDDGVGFDLDGKDVSRQGRHIGLISMRERVELMNGTFSIKSRPQEGTRIEIVLPVTEKEEK